MVWCRVPTPGNFLAAQGVSMSKMRLEQQTDGLPAQKGHPMKFGKLVILTAAVVLLAGLAQTPAQANVLGNPGFEDPITYDGPPFAGSWEGFTGGGASASNASVMPRSGAQHLLLQINDTPNTFTGVFQDALNLTAGEIVVFSGWHMTASSQADQGVEIRIEWRDTINDVEIARTPNFSPTLTGVYQQFSVPGEVPVGANSARLVYAIQSFSTGAAGDVIVYVDDVSFPDEGPIATEDTAWGHLKSLYR
jgi:hypothetical protein